MSMSNEHLEQIREHVRDAFRGLEVKGNTSWEGIVVLTDATELLAEVARLREAPTVTDEMVERAAKAQYRLDWGLYLDESEWSSYRETYRASARRVLEAALED